MNKDPTVECDTESASVGITTSLFKGWRDGYRNRNLLHFSITFPSFFSSLRTNTMVYNKMQFYLGTLHCNTFYTAITAVDFLEGFFAHLLILEDPDHHQTLISFSLYHSDPSIKFHHNPFITF